MKSPQLVRLPVLNCRVFWALATVILAWASVPAVAQPVVWKRLSSTTSAESSRSPSPNAGAWSRSAVQLGIAAAGASSTPLPARPKALEAPGFQGKQGPLTPSSRLILPSFEVDLNNPTGRTTLFSVRTHVAQISEQVQIRYHDALGNVLRSDTSSLSPGQVLPINLRDIPELVGADEGDGLARGFVTISTLSQRPRLTGDFFRVDPSQASGSGGVLVRAEDLCQISSMRFLNGGPFSGGTTLEFFVPTPRGGDPMTDEHTLMIWIFDESGQQVETWLGWTDRNVIQASIEDLPTSLTSGVLEIVIFDQDDLGGAVEGTLSAEGQYSIGFAGHCIGGYGNVS